VADLARSRAFYENVFGWEVADSTPGIVFFNLGGMIFSIFPEAEFAKDYGGDAQDFGPQRFALAHNLKSIEAVDATFTDLRAKGANIVKEPEQVFWGGYSGYVADPDGHKWEIAFNPFWAIGDDGRISFNAP
jgi:catechol 2,3-dioxygenase-like lactoylglutathione lyase family enzyme